MGVRRRSSPLGLIFSPHRASRATRPTSILPLPSLRGVPRVGANLPSCRFAYLRAALAASPPPSVKGERGGEGEARVWWSSSCRATFLAGGSAGVGALPRRKAAGSSSTAAAAHVPFWWWPCFGSEISLRVALFLFVLSTREGAVGGGGASTELLLGWRRNGAPRRAWTGGLPPGASARRCRHRPCGRGARAGSAARPCQGSSPRPRRRRRSRPRRRWSSTTLRSVTVSSLPFALPAIIYL